MILNSSVKGAISHLQELQNLLLLSLNQCFCHICQLKKRLQKMGPYLPDPNDTFEPDLHFDSFDCTWTFGPNPFEGVDLSLDWPSPPEGVRVVGFPWSDYAGHSCSRHGRISHLKSIKKQNIINCTVFENHRKSLIQHCERSELSLYL